MANRRNGWWWVPSLYFAEGMPYVVVMTVCTIMYKRLGVGNAEIAFYTSWLYLPWVIKPLWSPIIDIIGTKRRWIVVMQAMIAAGFGVVAFALPTSAFFSATLAAFWAVAFLSATHDIAADGFYMLGLAEQQQSFFVGIRTLFYRSAMISGQGLLVVLAGMLEPITGVSQAWMWVFAVLSALFVLSAIYHSFILPTPLKPDTGGSWHSIRAVASDFIDAFVSFFSKPGIGVAIAFMLLYRFPEAQLIKMISPFLLDSPERGGLGLTTSEVGTIYGTLGTVGLMLGGVVGGIVASRGGLRRWLMPMAWSMSLTCATFLYMSLVPAVTIYGVGACVFIEQLGYGFGSTAYTLYLIFFAAGKRSTSHYAMATGVMAFGMMIPGMISGALQQCLGYSAFFGLTMVCCAVTIVMAWLARRNVPADFGRNS